MGGFLQTLSQMSIQEDSSQAPDDTTSIKQEDSGDTQPQTGKLMSNFRAKIQHFIRLDSGLT